MNTLTYHKKFPKVLPLGYIYFSTDEGKIVVPDPKKADLVVLAFEMAGKGKSFRTILKTVTEQGLTSNRGNPLSLSSLHNMLANSFYIQDRLSHPLWLPLVSKTLFAKVQRVLKQNRCR
jgi:hypothetical protein